MLDAPRPRSSGQHMTFPGSPPTGGFRHNTTNSAPHRVTVTVTIGVDLRIPSTVVAVSLPARMYIANPTSQHLRITGNPGIQNSEAHIIYRMVTAVILVEVGESILDDAITPILTDLVVKITRCILPLTHTPANHVITHCLYTLTTIQIAPPHISQIPGDQIY